MEAAKARSSLHLSKYHIVGNSMSQLKSYCIYKWAWHLLNCFEYLMSMLCLLVCLFLYPYVDPLCQWLCPASWSSWPRGYITWVQSQTQNKAQWLSACGHVSTSSQSLRFILSLSNKLEAWSLVFLCHTSSFEGFIGIVLLRDFALFHLEIQTGKGSWEELVPVCTHIPMTSQMTLSYLIDREENL